VIAEDVLRRCRMPQDEIRWVLTADDPSVVHMILELHLERLEEELAERRRALGKLEGRIVTNITASFALNHRTHPRARS
jgi:hypothetical protein